MLESCPVDCGLDGKRRGNDDLSETSKGGRLLHNEPTLADLGNTNR
jgi:hypothetical protein